MILEIIRESRWLPLFIMLPGLVLLGFVYSALGQGQPWSAQAGDLILALSNIAIAILCYRYKEPQQRKKGGKVILAMFIITALFSAIYFWLNHDAAGLRSIGEWGISMLIIAGFLWFFTRKSRSKA